MIKNWTGWFRLSLFREIDKRGRALARLLTVVVILGLCELYIERERGGVHPIILAIIPATSHGNLET